MQQTQANNAQARVGGGGRRQAKRGNESNMEADKKWSEGNEAEGMRYQTERKRGVGKTIC